MWLSNFFKNIQPFTKQVIGKNSSSQREDPSSFQYQCPYITWWWQLWLLFRTRRQILLYGEILSLTFKTDYISERPIHKHSEGFTGLYPIVTHTQKDQNQIEFNHPTYNKIWTWSILRWFVKIGKGYPNMNSYDVIRYVAGCHQELTGSWHIWHLLLCSPLIHTLIG